VSDENLLDLTTEEYARWDSFTRVAVDFHLDRGTIREVLPQEAWDMIAAAQRSVGVFYIVGRALEQRRKGNDDFRVRVVEFVDEQRFLFVELLAAFHHYAPAGGAPRALVVPRSMLQLMIGTAMNMALEATLSFAPVVNGHPQLLFLGIPVLHEMAEKPF